MAIRIDRVDAGSEAEALGLAGGDELLSVDGNELNDTLDYDFYTDSKSFHLKARVADGIREWDVRREERGPFGCDFSTYLGDQKHSCSNHCMFCFIDQLPPGMRESLYFKDDDERLSFLFGNYITMTNMQDHEIDRIIKMHISPINISVHTTNPQLRVRMLANKRGGEVLKYLPRLVEGGIAVNCQLVLCRGINDGDELRRTLTDLLELTPMVQSVAAVPCGVTDYRQNLFKQTPYDAETSAAVIDIMEEFGDECKRRHGKRIIYPSDEWYLKAGRPIPEPEFYEDYDQLENGVGMMSLFREEFLAELEKPHRIYGTKKMDVVTGTMAAPLITEMMDELHRQYLWRFWTRLPKDGHIAIFDRTWYGRVMVERLEGFCSENDWKRAYNEINEFEKELSDWGAVIVKFWVHIDKDTQLARFNDRQNNPEKQWKITDEDWRNREKWDQYETAVDEMLQKTSTVYAPWHILESVDKKYARLKALRIVIEEIEKALK